MSCRAAPAWAEMTSGHGGSERGNMDRGRVGRGDYMAVCLAPNRGGSTLIELHRRGQGLSR